MRYYLFMLKIFSFTIMRIFIMHEVGGLLQMKFVREVRMKVMPGICTEKPMTMCVPASQVGCCGDDDYFCRLREFT